jgi:hypothetical protein
MFDLQSLTSKLPTRVKNQLESYFEALEILTEVKDPKVLSALGPSGIRGMILQRGKQGVPTKIYSGHYAFFDWSYPHDNAEMAELYRRAKKGQWDGDDLPWHISVDPYDPNVPLLPEKFVDLDVLERMGVKLDDKTKLVLSHSMTSWMLSQFLHGEQGALFAAAQVTESVQFFDGKFYGATQVMDEGRHVEVFRRYLESKLEKMYQVNDNLFVIIDSLMSDSRWDMKFLGMQIMVEGLALGAFGLMYKMTKEPLLKALLRNVIQDEARHVHYGVCALREHFTKHITEAERREREDWAFEVALLMRNRFMAYEVFEEHYEGVLTRAQWREFVLASPGLQEFRKTMFSRLVPNLREIGLMSPRILQHYERVGLMQYFGGLAADKLSGDQMLSELDHEAAVFEAA